MFWLLSTREILWHAEPLWFKRSSGGQLLLLCRQITWEQTRSLLGRWTWWIRHVVRPRLGFPINVLKGCAMHNSYVHLRGTCVEFDLWNSQSKILQLDCWCFYFRYSNWLVKPLLSMHKKLTRAAEVETEYLQDEILSKNQVMFHCTMKGFTECPSAVEIWSLQSSHPDQPNLRPEKHPCYFSPHWQVFGSISSSTWMD